jgi:ATP-binding cassette subfamily C protein
VVAALTPHGSLSTLKRLARALIDVSPRRSFAGLALLVGAGALEGIGLVLLVPLLQLVGIAVQSGPLGGIAAWVGRLFDALGTRPTLGGVLISYVAVAALQAWLQRRRVLVSARLEQDVVAMLRTRLYRAVAGSRWSFFSRARASDVSRTLTEEVDRVGSATYLLLDLAATSVMAAVYVAMALRVSPAMTALVGLCGATLLLGGRRSLAAAHEAGTHYSAASARLYAAVADHLGGMKIARSYGAEQRHEAAFARLSSDLNAVGVTTTEAQARLGFRLTLGSAAILAAVVYVAYGVLRVSAAQLLLLLFLFARLVPRLSSLYERAQTLATILPSFDVVSRLEQDCLAAAASPPRQPRPLPFEHEIVFERVSFTYREDTGARAVEDVSLSIVKGSTTAIVGPSGGGKSTLADLLMGLIEPVSGQVLVDGQRMTPDAMPAWRERIGYVPQDAFLFHETIRTNLLWAQPGASEADIWNALQQASADGFVAALPHGLETVVGDRGLLLSGGERQRLSLARALLRRPALLILDEATSSLDFENEQRIQDAIERLRETMTIVVITHRLPTVRRADIIHVFESGRLTESGSWVELLSSASGRFAHMCRTCWPVDSSTVRPSSSHRCRTEADLRTSTRRDAGTSTTPVLCSQS